MELRRARTTPRRAGARRVGLSVTGRVDRIDVAAAGAAVVRDYKGKTVHAGARWAQDGHLQAALYALAVRELLGLEPAGALYQPLGKGDLRPRGVRAPTACPAATSTATSSRPRRSSGAAGGARRRAGGRARACGRAGSAPCPARCSPSGCAYPGICRGAARASAPRAREDRRRRRRRAFTAEQRAAIADRSGSALLAANAGSGKTAVMVERFVEAVLLDGVAGRARSSR